MKDYDDEELAANGSVIEASADEESHNRSRNDVSNNNTYNSNSDEQDDGEAEEEHFSFETHSRDFAPWPSMHSKVGTL